MQIENNDDIWKYQTNLFRKEILLRHLFNYLHFKLGFCSYDYWYAKNWMMQTKQDSINGSLLKKFIVVYLNTPSRSFQFARRPNNIEMKYDIKQLLFKMVWGHYISSEYRLRIVIHIWKPALYFSNVIQVTLDQRLFAWCKSSSTPFNQFSCHN